MNLNIWVFRTAWIVWILWFLTWETLAVVNHVRQDTLSEQVWYMLHFHVLLRWLAAGFFGWLTVHFLFNGRFG
jgi:hypothetical protein